jgi:integrase
VGTSLNKESLLAAIDYIASWIGFQLRASAQPGCVIAIALKDRILLEQAFGVADLSTGEKLTPRHRFRVASHSKSFTAAGVMKLREQGKLKLDDAIGDYVAGLNRKTARATIGQILSHSAGVIRDGRGISQFDGRRPYLSARELLADLAADPIVEANSRFKYSNHGFALLGLLIEIVASEPFATWIRREVVDAAGLTETSPDMPIPKGTPFARGHSTKLLLGERMIFPGDYSENAIAPAGGFVATASDLCRYAKQPDAPIFLGQSWVSCAFSTPPACKHAPHILTICRPFPHQKVRIGVRIKMANRRLNKLSSKEVEAKGDGNWSDGGGLSLRVHLDGKARSWIFRYTVNHKVREMGLGKAGPAGVSLKDARLKRDELRRLLDQGHDPMGERRRRMAEREAKKTFAEVAAATVAKNQAGWKGAESSSSYKGWNRTLTREAAKLNPRPIDEITVEEVKRVVAPIWERGGHVEARMALTRLEAVFGYAIAHGWRSADNPASWTKVFKHIAPARPFGDAKPHPALDWREAPAALARLRQSAGMSALALEFAILTGTRIGETLGATYAEIDFDQAIWSIPKERMKRGLEHMVPLSERALEIAGALHERRGRSNLIFPGLRPGRPLNRAIVYEICMRATDGKSSIHGWRSTLRSWCSDHHVEFAVAESILAHAKAKVVAAYDRSAMVERRRPVMEQWSRFLGEVRTAEVVRLRRA